MTIHHLLPRIARQKLREHHVSDVTMRALQERRVFTSATPYMLERADGEYLPVFVACERCGFFAMARKIAGKFRRELRAAFAIQIEEDIPHPDFADSCVLILANPKPAAQMLGELHEWTHAERCCARGGEWYRRVEATLRPSMI